MEWTKKKEIVYNILSLKIANHNNWYNLSMTRSYQITTNHVNRINSNIWKEYLVYYRLSK
jgi:hypothetical protein